MMKSLAILLGKPKAKPDDEASESPEYSEEQTVMAEELIDAMKAGDAKGVLDAIHGIYQSYSMGMGEE